MPRVCCKPLKAEAILDTAALTCPRCFKTIAPGSDARFCPHCGLADVRSAALDTAPLEMTVGRRRFHVYDRIAIGSICTIYRCRFERKGTEVEGICKIARDSRSNDLVANEAEILRKFHEADKHERLWPFIPTLEEALLYGGDPSESPRQANILRLHEEIRSPDELYTLDEVKAQYPAGLESRDMAWIWRRLLTVLGFAHDNGVVHGAVLPKHILIDPRDHKLLLIDWCCAMHDLFNNPRPVVILDHGHEQWYRRSLLPNEVPTPALDIAFAARCMIELMGGDAMNERFPDAVEPALQRYMRRCLVRLQAAPVALKLLEEFDQLIEALWGRRKFRAFSMPPRQRA